MILRILAFLVHALGLLGLSLLIAVMALGWLA
jgi:hypothetical protein